MYVSREEDNPVRSIFKYEFNKAAANMALDLIKENKIEESFNLTMWDVLYKLTGIYIKLTPIEHNEFGIELTDTFCATFYYYNWKQKCLRSGSPPK